MLKRAFTLATRARRVFGRPHIEMLKEPAARSGLFEYPEFVKVRDLLPPEVRPLIEFRLHHRLAVEVGGLAADDRPCGTSRPGRGGDRL